MTNNNINNNLKTEIKWPKNCHKCSTKESIKNMTQVLTKYWFDWLSMNWYLI
jgi:hypothetical protein